MNVRKYFEDRLNGREFDSKEYELDNREFYLANQLLVGEISWKIEGQISGIVSFGGGEGLYEEQLANFYGVDYWLFDKRYSSWANITPKWVFQNFFAHENRLFALVNFVHVLKDPIAILEALPVGTQVVIIDTFMREPNTEWQLFFDNYMWEINGTRLPRMAQYESLPGWRLIAKHQNRRYLGLGYVIIRKVI